MWITIVFIFMLAVMFFIFWFMFRIHFMIKMIYQTSPDSQKEEIKKIIKSKKWYQISSAISPKL